jgi:hypothetical protein
MYGLIQVEKFISGLMYGFIRVEIWSGQRFVEVSTINLKKTA